MSRPALLLNSLVHTGQTPWGKLVEYSPRRVWRTVVRAHDLMDEHLHVIFAILVALFAVEVLLLLVFDQRGLSFRALEVLEAVLVCTFDGHLGNR